MVRSIPVILALAACGSPSSTSGDLDAYLRSLPSWNEVSPPVVEVEGPVGSAPVETDEVAADGTGFRCTSVEHELSSNPREIALSSPDASVLWPGALLHGDSHLEVGSLRAIPLRQDRRAPLGLSLQGGGVLGIPAGVSTVVNQPAGSTVREGINQLVANALAAGIEPGAGTSSFKMVETYSSEQALLELGFDARYLGAEASGSMLESSSFEENVVTATFVQRLFTASVDAPERPSDLFAADMAPTDLQELGIGEDNLPLYIDSVAYGRMLIVTMRSTESVDQMEAALSFSYDSPVVGVSGYGAEELASTLASSDIEVFALGGPNAGVEALITSGQLWSYFEADLQLNQVEPISFTVRNVADNQLAQVGDTTSYTVETCDRVSAPIPEPVHHWTADGHADDVVGDHDFESGFGGSYGAGIVGQAWSFDGESTYLLNHLAPLPVPADQPFAVSAWVHPRSDSDYMTIASQLGEHPSAGDFAVRLAPGGHLEFFRRPTDWDTTVDYVSGGEVPLNQWTHITAVYGALPGDDIDTMRIYINGARAIAPVVLGNHTPTRGQTYFRVGASELGPQEGDKLHLFDGDMDELKIYDTALSSDEAFIAFDNL